MTTASPLVLEYRANPDYQPYLQALRVSDGSVAWSTSDAGLSASSGADVFAFKSVLLADTSVMDTSLEAINLADGGIDWALPLPGISPSVGYDLTAIQGEPVIEQYTFDTNYLHFSAGKIVSIDAVSGAIRWQVATGDPPIAMIAIGPTIYALLANYQTLSTDGSFGPIRYTIVALDGSSGKEHWRMSSLDANDLRYDAIDAPTNLASSGTTIYVLSQASLSAYSANNGTLLWRVPAPEGSTFSV